MNKLLLKKEMLNKRRALPKEDVDNFGDIIFNKVINNKFYINSSIILCYVSFDKEVDTLGIIDYSLKNGKKVAIPKIIGNDMKFYYIESLSNLNKGTFGILEPTTQNEVLKDDIKKALLIVPGTSFSFTCYRNGYGKGYYDRFIANNKPKYKMGLAYDFQILDNIYSETYDEKLDVVISDKNIYNS